MIEWRTLQLCSSTPINYHYLMLADLMTKITFDCNSISIDDRSEMCARPPHSVLPVKPVLMTTFISALVFRYVFSLLHCVRVQQVPIGFCLSDICHSCPGDLSNRLISQACALCEAFYCKLCCLRAIEVSRGPSEGGYRDLSPSPCIHHYMYLSTGSSATMAGFNLRLAWV